MYCDAARAYKVAYQKVCMWCSLVETFVSIANVTANQILELLILQLVEWSQHGGDAQSCNLFQVKMSEESTKAKEMLDKAIEYYKQGFDLKKTHYSGINLCTLRFLRGDSLDAMRVSLDSFRMTFVVSLDLLSLYCNLYLYYSLLFISP